MSHVTVKYIIYIIQYGTQCESCDSHMTSNIYIYNTCNYIVYIWRFCYNCTCTCSFDGTYQFFLHIQYNCACSYKCILFLSLSYRGLYTVFTWQPTLRGMPLAVRTGNCPFGIKTSLQLYRLTSCEPPRGIKVIRGLGKTSLIVL